MGLLILFPSEKYDISHTYDTTYVLHMILVLDIMWQKNVNDILKSACKRKAFVLIHLIPKLVIG